MWYFVFRRQPLKSLFLAGHIMFLILVRIPFWTTVYTLIPGLRPRRTWSVVRSLTVLLLNAVMEALFFTDMNMSQPINLAAEENGSGFVWIDPVPELVTGGIRELAEINNVKAVRTGGYWFGPRDVPAGQRAMVGEKVIYHVHGGGYIMLSANHKWARPCYDGFLEHFPHNSRVFAIEYRLSAAFPFPASSPCPAAIIDALAGYRYLIEDVGFEPQNIILSGDSAGANIALMLAMHLTQSQFPSLPPPGRLLLLSPAVDLGDTHTEPGSSMHRNASSDYITLFFKSKYCARALVGRHPLEMANTSMWISPASHKLDVTPGMFGGLPPTCIFIGDAEIFLDQVRTLRDRLRAANGEEKIKYMEWADVTHDPFMWPWHESERTLALREIAKWLEEI